ncbi:MAG: hypothetical protein AAF581_08905 [Planctomycetota bacterium]
MTRKTTLIVVIFSGAALHTAFLLTQFNWSRIEFQKTRRSYQSNRPFHEIRQIGLLAVGFADDAPDGWFRFASPLTQEQRDLLHSAAHGRRKAGAHYLVTLEPIPATEQPGWTLADRRVIAVCDTPYRNMPGPWFGKAPLQHAVVYWDWRTELISTDEFDALDLSQFGALDELVPRGE